MTPENPVMPNSHVQEPHGAGVCQAFSEAVHAREGQRLPARDPALPWTALLLFLLRTMGAATHDRSVGIHKPLTPVSPRPRKNAEHTDERESSRDMQNGTSSFNGWLKQLSL
jgi:hypothetical protein